MEQPSIDAKVSQMVSWNVGISQTLQAQGPDSNVRGVALSPGPWPSHVTLMSLQCNLDVSHGLSFFVSKGHSFDVQVLPKNVLNTCH